MKSYQVADDLFLVCQSVSKKDPPAKPIETPTNHIVVTDCSGSMYGEIDRIKNQVKNKLPELIGESDTLTLVWFSGRGEYKTFVEAEPIRTMKDLSKIHRAIDEGFRARGLTGFKEPIEEVSRVVDRVAKARPGSVFSLIFMSDGCDNQWGRAEILKAVEKTAAGLASATFVEYGYYADRPLLTAMAERAGGNLIFAQNFDSYMPQLESSLKKRPTGAKRVEVAIEGDVIGGFVFMMGGGELVTYAVEAGKALVPEDTVEVWYLSPTAVGTGPKSLAAMVQGESKTKTAANSPLTSAAYAAMSLFSVRMQPNVVYPILKVLGDVSFIEQFSVCFGKQKYSEFMDATKAAAFDPKARLTKGYDPNKVPKDDAFTVLQVLQLLASDDENRVLLDHPSFKYSPIGRGRVDSSDLLTPEEQAEMDALTDELQKAGKDSKKIREVTAKIAAITANKQAPLKFEANPAPDGYPISSLTFNEDRPNVSFLVRKEGYVDVSSRLPDQFKGKKLGAIPEKFPTFVFRNYAVIKDGLVNIEALPVLVTPATLAKLKAEGVVTDGNLIRDDSGAYLLDLKALPIVNRKMVKAASAKALFEKEFELTVQRAAQRVFNSFKKEHFPGKKTESFDALYGTDGAAWLKEQGFTDYSGFGPKMVQAEAKDVYTGKALEVKLKGYSTIPSLNEFRKQAAKGKHNAPGELMKPFVQKVEAYLASPAYLNAVDKNRAFEIYLDDQAKAATKRVRELLFEMAQIKFAVVVGQVWFNEFSSIDENTLTIKTPDGLDIEGSVHMKEVEITI